MRGSSDTTSRTALGKFIVISGPSGVGKGAVTEAFLQRNPQILKSISCTTRAMRDGEVEGKHYRFISREKFAKLASEDFFLEWAEIYGHNYGTPRDFVLSNISFGRDVLLEIDTQGATQVRKNFDKSLLILLLPPTLDDLVLRLRKRGTENTLEIQRRVIFFKEEMKRLDLFDYGVINDTVENAVLEIEKIIRAESLRIERLSDFLEKLEGSFTLRES